MKKLFSVLLVLFGIGVVSSKAQCVGVVTVTNNTGCSVSVTVDFTTSGGPVTKTLSLNSSSSFDVGTELASVGWSSCTSITQITVFHATSGTSVSISPGTSSGIPAPTINSCASSTGGASTVTWTASPWQITINP